MVYYLGWHALSDKAKERILAAPYDMLSSSAKTLREQMDREEVSSTLRDIQKGVYG